LVEARQQGGRIGGEPTAGTRRSRLAAVSGVMGKAGWNLVDQILSSGTNATLSIVVARNVDAAGFGAFSVAFLLFALLIAVQRAMAGQVLSIRHSAVEPHDWPAVAGRALGAVVAVAGSAGIVLIVVGVLIGGQLRWPLIALGVTAVPLVLQDTVRSIYFARSRADLAALNDGLFAVAALASMGVLIASGRASVGGLIVAWGASACLPVGSALVQMRTVPNPAATRGWVREHRDLLVFLLPETLITSGGDKVAYLIIGHLVDLSAVGAVNAARQILNPLLVVTSAAVSFAMPEISRRAHLSPRVRRRIAFVLGAVQAVGSLAYTLLVLVAPDSVGLWAFQDTWQGAREIILPMGLFATLASLCMGPFVVIAAMGHARRTFRVTVVQVVLTVLLMPAGAVLGGAPGSAWGLVVAKTLEIPLWLQALRSATRLGPVPARPGREPAQASARPASSGSAPILSSNREWNSRA